MADDQEDADAVRVLTFGQAQDRARVWFERQFRRSQGLDEVPAGPYTIAQCMADYLHWFRAHRKSYEQVRLAVEAHILPDLGKYELSNLSAVVIKQWLQVLAERPPRVRSRKGGPRQFRAVTSPDDLRKRKVTANRIFTILKAALNKAFEDGRVESDSAWRRVRGYRGVDAAKVLSLKTEEAKRLLEACAPDFRALVLGALFSGCRFGELIALQVGDVKAEQAALHIRESKSSKARHVYLNREGERHFLALCEGRPRTELLFLKSDGEPWGRSEQTRRLKLACQEAGLGPEISFHILRHTYASHYLMTGGTLPALAQQLGHADTRMTTRHYAHLAESWRAAEAKRTGLRLDL